MVQLKLQYFKLYLAVRTPEALGGQNNGWKMCLSMQRVQFSLLNVPMTLQKTQRALLNKLKNPLLSKLTQLSGH